MKNIFYVKHLKIIYQKKLFGGVKMVLVMESADVKEPFYKKIQKFVETKISDECLKICKTRQQELFLPKIITKESLYYYFIYSKLFPKLETYSPLLDA